MILKGVIFEDIVNYKKTSMTLLFPHCSFKCNKEQNKNVCQNISLYNEPNIDVDIFRLIGKYVANPLTRAIVMQGLEPLDSFDDVFHFIKILRTIYECHDDLVIYTGYRKEEVYEKILKLKQFDNIIIKFGRYIPNDMDHYDDILGVMLASNNQYGEKIS